MIKLKKPRSCKGCKVLLQNFDIFQCGAGYFIDSKNYKPINYCIKPTTRNEMYENEEIIMEIIIYFLVHKYVKYL